MLLGALNIPAAPPGGVTWAWIGPANEYVEIPEADMQARRPEFAGPLPAGKLYGFNVGLVAFDGVTPLDGAVTVAVYKGAAETSMSVYIPAGTPSASAPPTAVVNWADGDPFAVLVGQQFNTVPFNLACSMFFQPSAAP
jgi:hypothetical protein